MEETTNIVNGSLRRDVKECFFYGRGKTVALEGLVNKSRHGSCLHLAAVAKARIDELMERGLESAARGASYIETLNCMEGQRGAQATFPNSLEP